MSFAKESIGYVAQEKLWLSADGKIVKDGDHRAAILLAAKGHVVPEKTAKRLKLDTAKVEPLEVPRVNPTVNFGPGELPHFGGRTVAPEQIESRSTRPEKAESKR